jgi:amidase
MQDGNTWERRVDVDGVSLPYDDLLFWPGLTCGYHLPASVAPVGLTRAGLPVGVQIVGPLFGDRTTIAVADHLDRGFYSFVAPPGWE